MFEVGGKIDFWKFYVQNRSQNRSVTILNLYMGGGAELTDFPPSIHVFIHVFTPVSTPVWVYAHLFDFSGNFRNSWKIYEPNKWKKCVSLLEFGACLDFVAILAPQQQKKRKPKDSTFLRTFGIEVEKKTWKTTSWTPTKKTENTEKATTIKRMGIDKR